MFDIGTCSNREWGICREEGDRRSLRFKGLNLTASVRKQGGARQRNRGSRKFVSSRISPEKKIALTSRCQHKGVCRGEVDVKSEEKKRPARFAKIPDVYGVRYVCHLHTFRYTL
jgi:hypothetical protein